MPLSIHISLKPSQPTLPKPSQMASSISSNCDLSNPCPDGSYMSCWDWLLDLHGRPCPSGKTNQRRWRGTFNSCAMRLRISHAKPEAGALKDVTSSPGKSEQVSSTSINLTENLVATQCPCKAGHSYLRRKPQALETGSCTPVSILTTSTAARSLQRSAVQHAAGQPPHRCMSHACRNHCNRI